MLNWCALNPSHMNTSDFVENILPALVYRKACFCNHVYVYRLQNSLAIIFAPNLYIITASMRGLLGCYLFISQNIDMPRSILGTNCALVLHMPKSAYNIRP